MRVLSFYIGLLALVAAPAAALAEGEPVDVQLVLAVDSSSSVDMDEYYLQLEGYAGAFRHPDLVRAVQSGPHKAIAVTLFEWSGPDQQVVNLPWRILRDGVCDGCALGTKGLADWTIPGIHLCNIRLRLLRLLLLGLLK